ncbi:MAG: response regulator [Elusimicrobiota bacterium]
MPCDLQAGMLPVKCVRLGRNTVPLAGLLFCREIMGRILIVDDNADVCRFLSSAVLKYDHSVVDTAVSVTDAIWKFTENHYDVLITDINMPEVSGHFLINHVKKYFSECKIIAISSDHLALEDAKKFGAAVCLTKPFSVTELMEHL